jgi:hypothetical protein
MNRRWNLGLRLRLVLWLHLLVHLGAGLVLQLRGRWLGIVSMRWAGVLFWAMLEVPFLTLILTVGDTHTHTHSHRRRRYRSRRSSLTT